MRFRQSTAYYDITSLRHAQKLGLLSMPYHNQSSWQSAVQGPTILSETRNDFTGPHFQILKLSCIIFPFFHAFSPLLFETIHSVNIIWRNSCVLYVTAEEQATGITLISPTFYCGLHGVPNGCGQGKQADCKLRPIQSIFTHCL